VRLHYKQKTKRKMAEKTLVEKTSSVLVTVYEKMANTAGYAFVPAIIYVGMNTRPDGWGLLDVILPGGA